MHEEADRVAAELIARHGPVVQGGPFAGLRLPSRTAWGFLPPLLVGSYEEEIHSPLEELIAASPRRVINVGCAEGYYAVGLARRLPAADVYAFDVDEEGQRLTRETAEANGVAERVHVEAACTVDRLEQLTGPETLLIVDCEGCELELLRPDRAPSLRLATLVVELHDFINPGISSATLARFRPTHSIDLISARDRVSAEYPAAQELDPSDRAIAVAERRPTDPQPMEWVVLTPFPT